MQDDDLPFGPTRGRGHGSGPETYNDGCIRLHVVSFGTLPCYESAWRPEAPQSDDLEAGFLLVTLVVCQGMKARNGAFALALGLAVAFVNGQHWHVIPLAGIPDSCQCGQAVGRTAHGYLWQNPANIQI